MPKASPIQTSFNAGEFAPSLEGRVDLGKYSAACKQLVNFIPMIQGPARRRSGTRFVQEVKNSANRTWLVRFEFAETDAYVLEFGNQYIRFYTNHGQVLTGSVAAWVTSTAYKVGDLRSNGGVNYYCREAHTSGTFATDLAAGKWYALSGSIYEIPTPYTAANLTNANGTLRLRMVQSGDVIYIVHPSYPPKKLSRFGPTNWTLTDVDFKAGPFLDIDPDETRTVYASAATGTVTITASAALFSASDVGTLFLIEEEDLSYIKPWDAGQELSKSTTTDDGPNVLGILRRSDGKTYKCVTNDFAPTSTPESVIRTGGNKPIHTRGVAADGDGESKYPPDSDPTVYREGVDWEFQDPGYGWVKITGFTSSTVVTATVVSRLPDGVVGSGNTTNRWALSRWSSARGWPSHVAFFRERLCFSTGQILNFSVSADFENFNARNDSGEIAPDQAITIEISSDKVNEVQWLQPADGLLIGTSGGEFLCKELTTDEVFGPGNVKIVEQSAYGSKSVIPVQVGESVLFVQRSGRKLRELQYEFSSDKFKSSDLTVLAEHITSSGIVDIVYQQEPHSIIWCALTNGQLIGFTFNREQDVLGWHKHPIGGSGIVECMETIPNPNGTQDDLWMIVRRTINGQTKRYIEYLEEDFTDETDIKDAFFVDSGLTYTGAPATTISGLSHLEGKEVAILVDGAAHPNETVTSGSITLQRPGSKVHVGLAYPSTLQTMRIEAGAGDGTAQGKTKRITKAVIRFLATVGAKAGADASALDEIQFRQPSMPMDQAVPPFTGDKLIEWPGTYDFDGYIYVQQPQPLPMTVVAIMPQVITQDR
jgi:hypothetical protein